MHIAVVTIGDASKVGFWSGTPHYMARALARLGHEITLVGPLSSPLQEPYRAVRYVARQMGLQMRHPLHVPRIADGYARDAVLRITTLPQVPDLILAIAGASFVWALPSGLRVIYASDATLRLAAGYHPNLLSVTRGAFAEANAREARSIARADLVTYPSRWAAESAVRDYGADPARVLYLPWGANLDGWPSPDPTPNMQAGRAPLRLLLVGGSWHFKGADIAVETLRRLRAGGLDAELSICGCTPPQPLDEPGLTVIPFLDKSDPAQMAQLGALYRQADLFLMPTRSDCYGIVFCEAAAYALPSVAPATGGVPSSVQEGVNGHLVPEGSGAEAYVQLIRDLAADRGRLSALSASSRRRFEAELNWDAWAVALMRSLDRA
jgi:glycosyltransferase involved in cell wall biosynthesis